MRKTLAVILCALMILPLAFVGISAAEPEVITTAEQFAAIKKDGNYKLGADIAVASTIKYIEKQIKDGKEVDVEVGFAGTLDGDGHKITVSAPIFSRLSGTVKNLVIEGAVSATGDSEHCAPLALRGSEKVVIDNIINKATVATKYRGAGIISQIDDGATATITNCTNEGSVTHTGSKSSMIGGIIAYQQGQSLVIENCVNTGTVSTAIGTAGGILGRFGGDNDYNPEGIRTVTIKNCLNTGAVTGTTYVGGILGHARSAKVVIESCTNKGEIKAVYDNAEKKSGGKNDAGGIFGSTGSDNSTSTAAATKWYPCDLFIRKCINEGNVTCENGRAAGILSYSWCGGRNGGYPHSEVTDCVNKGTITAGSFASQILAYTNDTKAMEGGAPQPTQIKNCVGLGKLQRSATAAREEAKYYPVIFGLSSSKYATNYDVLLTIVENDGLGWYAYSEGTEANRVPLANAPADKLFIKSAAEAEAAAKALGQIGYVAPQSTNPSQPTGDTAVWVLVIAGVSLLGMGIALKARKA